MPDDQVGGFLLSNLFQHAQIREGLNAETLGEVVGLYRFAAAALGSL